jgi:hypothetical protein
MRMLIIKAATGALCMVMTAGCAITQGDVNTAYDAANRAGLDAMAGIPTSLPLVEDVDSAFLGDRQVPVAYDASLPPVFREKQVTLPANLGIRQIATLVSNATGYAVHMSPDC